MGVGFDNRLKQDRRERRGQNLTLEFLSRQHAAGAGAMISGEDTIRTETVRIMDKRLQQKKWKDRRLSRTLDERG